ncbi:hypothetical protein BU14_2180s0001 [Porphyra umbilicalis]|uniref:Uncharacterized protein n=1 Tax=Porphyra umbilicalis TaxID=2786 RepID=A0A1X6NJR7_PORUM|nr:hypothetical protein BU14_2180s0001 [Porphyra umbilicalis]|eukprot:OSX68845.1 hypothetical protein BU14_2180s0001 [Porphyra umbilicalis]
MAPLAFAAGAVAAARSPFAGNRTAVTARPATAVVAARRPQRSTVPTAGLVDDAKDAARAAGDSLQEAVNNPLKVDGNAAVEGVKAAAADPAGVVRVGVQSVQDDVATTGEAIAAEPAPPSVAELTDGIQTDASVAAADTSDAFGNGPVGTAGGNAVDAVKVSAAQGDSPDAAANIQAAQEAQDRVDANPVVAAVSGAAASAAASIQDFSNKSMDAAQAVGDAAAETAAKKTGADIKQNYGENHPSHD